MTIRRDGSLMRSTGQSICGSRIAVAISIGVFLGGVFAFYYPHGFFSTNDLVLYEAQKISKLNSQLMIVVSALSIRYYEKMNFTRR